MSLIGSAVTRRLCVTCRRRSLPVAAARLTAHPVSWSARHVQPLRRILDVRRTVSTTAVAHASRADQGIKKRKVDMDQFPPERIRNLSIIAHIDHGKSTLADRLLQMTNTLPPSSSPQFLDKLKVERERGITVKAQTVSIIHTHTDGERYLINLIDTPGHVDFSYEVSRSLGACEGGLLLVDSTQGIQAQTLSVFYRAVEASLTLLAVINKVDLPHASPAEVSEQIATSLGLAEDKHMRISAKSGLGVDHVLNQIIDGLPAPAPWKEDDGKLRGLVFDHFYDHFRGVVALVRLFSGTLKKGDKIKFLQSDRKYDVLEVGIQNPEEVVVDTLREGQVGYVVCNMKNSEDAFIGDTVCHADALVEALPGFQPMKAMVYAGVFPIDGGEFPKLEEAIERLTLNDRSVTIQRESSAALSQGFRLGFLGTLHMDVFRQRLEDEYDSNVIVTAPTVPYKVRHKDGSEVFISNPAEFPDVTDPKARVAGVEEPMVNATIFVPSDYIGGMMDLCSRYRGVQQEYKMLDGSDRAILKYSFPLAEIVTDFFSELKSVSSGFASFDYDEAGYASSDLVKLNMMLNGKPVDALAMIVHRSAAALIGRAWTKKLRDVLPRQLFEVAIQAAIGSKVVARETLSAVRKDVTAGLYGGHYERKLKHLNKQKEGKKRLKRLAGNIDIPQSAFFDVLSSRPRTFSTSARQLAPSADPFSAHLPQDLPPPSIDLSSSFPSSPRPLTTPNVDASSRSAGLSDIHRLLSESPVDSGALLERFDDLSLASPGSNLFTPSELSAMLLALTKIDRQQRSRSRSKDEQVRRVYDELESVSNGASKGVEQVLLASLRAQANNTTTALRDIDTRMAELFPRQPGSTDTRQLQRYRVCVNYILQLCAISGDVGSFDKWSSRLKALSLPEDSYSAMARLGLIAKNGDSTAIRKVLADMLAGVRDASQQIMLINFALWSLATRGSWGIVVPSYHQLVPSAAALDIPGIELGDALNLPTDIEPTYQTFAGLLHALSHQGYYTAALTVFRTMIEMGHQPHVPEYVSLFKGFARYGQVPPTSAGRLASSFPLWENFAAPSPDTPSSRGQSISQIWQRDASRSAPYPDAEGGWTEANLREIFTSFLRLEPLTTSAQAPTPSQVWTVLMAFARCSNADSEAVMHVWEAMALKFSEGEWWGWRLDGRLRRIVAKMEEREDEQ